MVREVWRKIPGYPDYSVSSRARVRRDTEPLKRTSTYPGKLLKIGQFKNRRAVSIFRKGKQRKHVVAYLMLLAFRKRTGPLARHLNDNPRDDRLSNLAWGSHRDNARDAIRNGRWPVRQPGPSAVAAAHKAWRTRRVRYGKRGHL